MVDVELGFQSRHLGILQVCRVFHRFGGDTLAAVWDFQFSPDLADPAPGRHFFLDLSSLVLHVGCLSGTDFS